jgi:hypothetical protein
MFMNDDEAVMGDETVADMPAEEATETEAAPEMPAEETDEAAA